MISLRHRFQLVAAACLASLGFIAPAAPAAAAPAAAGSAAATTSGPTSGTAAGSAGAASTGGAAASGAGAPAAGKLATPTGASTSFRRVKIPGPDGKPLPYTVELPAGWEVQPNKTMGGVFIGPAGLASPESDPRAIIVRLSKASLADPAATVANIKSNEKKDGPNAWTAAIDEVKEVGGVRGVLVRMDVGAGATARSTLVLKLPYGKESVDLMASSQRDDFEHRRAGYERVMFSIQQTQPTPAPAQTAH